MLDRVASNIFYGLTNFLSSQILIMVRCFGVIQILREEDVDALCMMTFNEALFFYQHIYCYRKLRDLIFLPSTV